MAVLLVTSIQQYIGLSTDEKPDDCAPGSTFFETDSLDWYTFDGADWHPQ